MKELIKNALTLCLITLVAGLLLGTVYEITKTPRKEQEEKQKQKAYQKVFQEADLFEKYELNESVRGELEDYLGEQGISASKAYVAEIVTAMNSKKEFLGYVITVTDKEGYGGDIQLAVGIQKDGTVNGISILSISETAGLGMEAKKNYFKEQFSDKKVSKFVYTKSGAAADNEIDALSGATITTNAVTNGVNAAILSFDYLSSDKQQEEGGAQDE